MLLRGKDMARKLAALEPPFDAETERELIAIAFTPHDANVKKLARDLVLAHVPGGKELDRKFGRSDGFEDVRSEDLRALARPDRGQLAVAMLEHGSPGGYGVAFEQDEAFARAALGKMLRKKLLDLSGWSVKDSLFKFALATIPDLVFDEIPALRKKSGFDELKVYGPAMKTLPARFLELAPFLRKLELSFLDIRAVPDVVCELTALEELVIDAEQLRQLNPRLAQLQKLRKLDVNHAEKLSSLPREIFELRELEHLGVQLAGVREVPAEIAKLTKLQSLKLYNTPVVKLAPELAGLEKLKKIDLQYTKVDKDKARALLPKRVKLEV